MIKSTRSTHASDTERMRPRLLALAYRMLGSAADAEDAVQDAYLRLQQADDVASPDAWLVKATTRLCIDRLRQVRRRAEYVGPWLPEPISDTWEGSAADRVEMAESLSMAFLVLLEALSPSERAAYLLREVFDYEYEEIAALLDKSAVNVRQIAARARKRLEQKERRFQPTPTQADDLAGRFFDACQSGDLGTIEALLAEEVIFFPDGGGKAHAVPRPIVGRHRIANLLAVSLRKRPRTCQLTAELVNGQPGFVVSEGGTVIQILTFSVEGGRIRHLYSVLNPDKLGLWNQPNPTDPGAHAPGEP